jgi:hypothetical protein
MRKTALAILCALAGAGCFFGGDGDTSTVDKIDTLPKAALVKPGLYVAEYPAWRDTTAVHLQSEISIAPEGTFRMFWIDVNESVYERRGSWAQRDSSLYFGKLQEAFLSGNGAFNNYSTIDDDTNSISGVTDSSFIRREYTPLRQKPYWITYAKKTFPAIKDGDYEFETNFKEDTLPAVKLNFKLTLKGHSYVSSVSLDGVEKGQDSASWYQIGSFLALESNFHRAYIDSTKSYAPWDTINGLVMNRMQSISDASFQLWYPSGYVDTVGVWGAYNRKP